MSEQVATSPTLSHLIERPLMKIDEVDVFYLKSPKILDIGDGSQDALLVRIRGGGHEAGRVRGVAAGVDRQTGCVRCRTRHARTSATRSWAARSTILKTFSTWASRCGPRVWTSRQTDHTWSGVEIALWDLLGKAVERPVYELLGYERSFPKIPYASVLFGDSPESTFAKAQACRKDGYHAAKFGWGVYGRSTVEVDAKQVRAAREGLGADSWLMGGRRHRVARGRRSGRAAPARVGRERRHLVRRAVCGRGTARLRRPCPAIESRQTGRRRRRLQFPRGAKPH